MQKSKQTNNAKYSKRGSWVLGHKSNYLLNIAVQPSMPEIDANLIDNKIQYNFEMDVIKLGEVTQKKTLCWFIGEFLFGNQKSRYE